MISKNTVESYRRCIEENQIGSHISITRDDLEQFVNLYDLYLERDKELREIQATIQAEGLMASLRLHMDVYNRVSPGKEEDVVTIYEIVSSIMEDINELIHDNCLPDSRKCLLMDAYVKARDFCNELERAEELENSEEMEEDYIR